MYRLSMPYILTNVLKQKIFCKYSSHIILENIIYIRCKINGVFRAINDLVFYRYLRKINS